MIYKKRVGNSQTGTVILVHGQGEHSGRYETFIRMLANQGYAVEFFDWPGHGESSGKQGHTSIEEGVNIIDSIVHKIDTKPFLLGHSMGGLTVIRYAQLYPKNIRGIIVSSPELAFDTRIPSIFHHISRFLNIFMPTKTTSNMIRPEELSRNKKIVKKYIQNPLIHDRISLSLHQSIANNMNKAIQESSTLSCPILILIGTEDKIVPTEKTKEFYQNLAVKDKTLHEFEGAFHEVFDDPEWKESFNNAIMNWINNN